MTGEDIERERGRRAMSYEEFGRWLADQINKDRPEEDHVRPYGRTRVYEWAHNRVAVPANVKLLFKDLEIQRLRRELADERDRDRDEDRERGD